MDVMPAIMFFFSYSHAALNILIQLTLHAQDSNNFSLPELHLSNSIVIFAKTCLFYESYQFHYSESKEIWWHSGFELDYITNL